MALVRGSDVPDGAQEVAEPIAQVVLRATLKPGYSPRLKGEDLDHVAALAEAGTAWPPIVVHKQTLRVIDGMHRLRAAELRGEHSIEVKFFDGDVDEAFVAAVRANVTHGLPLTLADRKAAARQILGRQPERSDRWIGEVTGLASGTVAAVRRGAGSVDATDTSRIGRDGRVRPLNPADGRLRARQEIIARPGASLRQIAKAAGISPATAKKVRDRLRREDDAATASAAVQADEIEAPAPSRFGTGSGRRKNAGASAQWLLHRLRNDPSLRYSEYGRNLLRQLEPLLRGPGAVQPLMDAVPAHCGYVIASLARECARQWLEVADVLERQLEQASTVLRRQDSMAPGDAESVSAVR